MKEIYLDSLSDNFSLCRTTFAGMLLVKVHHLESARRWWILMLKVVVSLHTELALWLPELIPVPVCSVAWNSKMCRCFFPMRYWSIISPPSIPPSPLPSLIPYSPIISSGFLIPILTPKWKEVTLPERNACS